MQNFAFKFQALLRKLQKMLGGYFILPHPVYSLGQTCLETTYRSSRINHRANVKAVDCVRDLGVHLDSRLDLRTHISRIVSTCYFHLRRLRHLRHMVSQETRQRLVSALILSRIDYGSVIFAGLPGVTLAPLRRDFAAEKLC